MVGTKVFSLSVLSEDDGNIDIEEASEGQAPAGSEPDPAALRATSIAGAVSLGRMRLSDFEVTAGAAAACKAVADFAAPSSVLGLFEDAPLKDMFAGIKANAAKVRFDFTHTRSRLCYCLGV